MLRRARDSGAHIAIGIFASPGAQGILTQRTLLEGRPGFAIVVLPLDEEDTMGRWANLLLHTIGHSLGLIDAPRVAGGHSLQLIEPEKQLDWHDGIRGGYYDTDAGTFKGYHSEDQDTPPLMDPNMGQSGYWILRHHYMHLHERIEDGLLDW